MYQLINGARVFPAQAGVILAMLLFMMHLVSFPRASGGDPELALGSAENGAVFPAQAGVIHVGSIQKPEFVQFSPRKRG